jgi:uncharacterized membrane protein YoaK (UPF0700 family)
VASRDSATRGWVGLGTAVRPEASTVRDALLVGLTFAAGSVDAIAFLGLDKVFSSFMTGNLVFLGLVAGGTTEPDVPRVASALAAFAAGVVLAVWIVKPTRDSQLWPRRVSVALGVGALAQASFLAWWWAVSGLPSGGAGDGLIALSALSFGMQSAAVMSLNVKGVFTTAATATVIMLMSDEAGWSRSAHERQRFVGVILALVAGAAAGTFLLLHVRAYAPVLPLVVTLLVIAAAGLALRDAR